MMDVEQDLTVTYASDMGTLQLGWTGPMIVDGREIDLHANPRYDNPFTHVEWGETRFEITAGGVTSALDFEGAERIVE